MPYSGCLPAAPEVFTMTARHRLIIAMPMLAAGLAAFFVTLIWVRQREMREKYALVWMLIALFLLTIGTFPQLLYKFASWAKLSFPAAVLFIALALMYFFSFFVTVTLSRAHRRTARLLQEVALLEKRIRELEGGSAVNETPESETGPELTV